MMNKISILFVFVLLSYSNTLVAQVLVSKVNSYDAYGNPLEVEDAHGVVTSYAWNKNGTQLLGVFKNASNEEVLAHSFAYDGLDNWTYTDYENNISTDWDIVRGRLKMTHFGTQSSNWGVDQYRTSLATEHSDKTVIELDVTVGSSTDYALTIGVGGSSWNGQNGGSENLIWTAFQYGQWKSYNGVWTTIESDFQEGETYSLKIVADPVTDKVDYYVNGELKISGLNGRTLTSGIQTLSFGNYGRSTSPTEWYIDNVRLYPESAQAVTQEVSSIGYPVAIKEADGMTMRYTYDDFGRLASVINHDGQVLSEYTYTYAGDAFSSTNPNQVEAITYVNPLFNSDFSTSVGWSSVHSTHNTFNVGMAGQTTVRMGSGGSWEGMDANLGSEEVYAKIDFYPDHTTGGTPHIMLDGAGHRFAVHYKPDNDSFRIQYRKNSGSWQYPFTFALDAPPEEWYTIELEKVEGQLTAWVYPKEEGRSAAESYSLGGFSSSWTPKFVLSGNDNYYYASNLIVSESWQRGVSYIDGLGREIQSQQLGGGGEETVVSGVIYDARGNPSVSARPISESNVTSFMDDLFSGSSSFTPGGALPASSSIYEYYESVIGSDGHEYAYSFTEYEASPLNRVSTARMPGTPERSVTTDYGVVDTPQEQFAFSSGALSKTTTTDPEGGISITYTDGWGRTVASGVDMDQDGLLNGDTKNSCNGASCDLITEFDYDELGNVTESKDPRGHSTTYAYNALGQLVEKKLPDQSHPHAYRYDDKGRLRFHRDPNLDAGSNHYYYTKYDELDRPTEMGKYKSSANFDDPVDINTQSYPSSNTDVYVLYSYDGVNAASGTRNHKGRVSEIQYKDLETGSWGYTWYSYNELGAAETIIQRLPGHTNYDDRTISYTYDAQGRLTRVSYDGGYSATADHHFWYDYDGLGRLARVRSHPSNDKAAATIEAEYTYFADGQVEQLILGEGVQTIDYDYTVQGWLDDINDGIAGLNNFSMSLEYTLSGNIERQTWYQKESDPSGLFPSYQYTYDQANRLTQANFNSNSTYDQANRLTQANFNSNSDYDVSYTYDKSGNMELIQRRNENGTYALKQGHLNMAIDANSNKITSVYDIQSDNEYDIVYDANGNIKEHALQGITSVSYDWRNLPTRVVTDDGTTITYAYDAEGNRVKKQVQGGATTHYIRGADGQTIAAYDGYTIKFLNILAGGQIIGQITKN